MFSRKAITVIATGAAAVAVAVGTYGIVNATGSNGSSTANAATGKVIPFQRGAPGAQTAVGQVPQGWTPGSGTIVTGTNANKAKAAAVAAYSGGTVDRDLDWCGRTVAPASSPSKSATAIPPKRKSPRVSLKEWRSSCIQLTISRTTRA